MLRITLQPRWHVGQDDGPALDANTLLQLLAAVQASGSISQAGRELDLSYRHAWGLLQQAEALFGQAGAENRSVTDWMGEAQKSIAAQERRRKVPASQPRIFVGDEAKAWANQPLKNWLQAPKAP